MRIPLLARAAALALPVVVLVGCAPATTPSATSNAEPSSDASAVIDNCGFEVKVPAEPPRRIVTIKSTSTELLLALGLGDRIVGQAFPDGPVPDEWADEAASIPTISEFAPSEEAVLDLEPDFVFGGWESNFAADTAGERDELASLGIGTYVSPAACKAPGYLPDPLTSDLLFDFIDEAGRLFGATDAAHALVAEQRRQLASVTPDDRGLTALWWSSGEDVPYVGAGLGAPQLMLDALGLTNVAGEVRDTWTSMGWEAIADANPDLIVLVDASWNTAESKIAALEADPVLSQLDAVTHERYLRIPFPAAEAGARTVPAIVDLSEQLAALDLD